MIHLLAVAAVAAAVTSSPLADFRPLMYGNTGTAFLKNGLFPSVMTMDFDGDGDLDVVMANGGIPTKRGTWLYENASPAGTRPCDVVFKPGRRIDDCKWNVTSSRLSDGRVAVTEENRFTFDYPHDLRKGMKAFKDLPANVHVRGVRCNKWRFVDYDGDGRDDLVVMVGDWAEYGWHDKWDKRGIWKNANVHGWIYLVPNESTAGEEKWGEPRQLKLENEEPLEVWGNPVAMFEDWDRDGDLDVIVADFTDNFRFFENVGTRTAPVYTLGRLLRDAAGRRLQPDLCIPAPTAVDWDADGRMDFLCAEEDGRVGFYRNTGKLDRGMPVFEAPTYLREERNHLHFGLLATPATVDWDGDGDLDIISGNSAGYVAFIENLSGKGVAEPQWAEPKLLSCARPARERTLASSGGLVSCEPIRLMAGPNGSIQGPIEKKWGYTCLSVGDWDGDGLCDILVNTIWGKPLVFRNVGTRTAPKLAAPAGLEVAWEGAQPALAWGWYKPDVTDSPRELITQWRTTPLMYDLDGDGLMDLVMLDQAGTLAYFRRARRDGRLVLLPPAHVLCDEKGEPLALAGRGNHAGPPQNYAGGSGRKKIALLDWDGDGKVDLLVNSKNAVWYRQVKAEDGKWFFQSMGDISTDVLAGHSTSPCRCDFDGDGRDDCLMGCEDGFFYVMRNPTKRK